LTVCRRLVPFRDRRFREEEARAREVSTLAVVSMGSGV
jgi:hypothetical protein